MAETADKGLRGMPLSDAIQRLRGELVRAMAHGSDERIQFALGEVELEMKVAISVEASAKAEAKFWVIAAGGGSLTGRAEGVHTLRLKLRPVDGWTVAAASGEVRVADLVQSPSR